MPVVVERLWVSSLLRQPLQAADGRVGPIADGVVRLVGSGYPPLTGLVAERDGQGVFVPVRALTRLGPDGATTSRRRDELDPFERRESEILLARDLLGHHLISTRSRLRPRLVSAEDVALADDGGWHVTGVDVAGHARWRRRRPPGEEARAAIVDWLDVEPFVGHVPTARLRLGLRKLRHLHPARIADLLEEASDEEGREILGALEADRALEADVVEELEPTRRVEALRHRPDPEIAAILASMAPDDAADLLASLDQPRREPVLDLVPAPQQAALRALLGYHPETAGGMMTTQVVAVPVGTPVAEALAAMRAAAADLPENAGGVFVVDEGHRLVSFASLLRLTTAAATASVDDIAQSDPPRVRAQADVVEVAVTMADYNLVTLAVVDEENVLLGAITVDDVLARVLPASWRRRMEALEGA